MPMKKKSYNHILGEQIKALGQAIIDRDDICVCCGRYVPEGRMVCYFCERLSERRE